MPSLSFAQEVNLNVTVRERKPTDTINDFQLASISGVPVTPTVLGAQSERTPDSSWTNIWMFTILPSSAQLDLIEIDLIARIFS